MQISSEFVGWKSRPYQITLTPRRTMNFAASVFDANPWYFNDERPEGIVAPPMIAVALSWHMTVDAPKYWDVPGFPHEVLTRQVHYSEAIEWHRPMLPNDTLTVVSEIAAIFPHRAGTHMINRYVATNAAGEEVFTEYAGAMLRDVKCTDHGKGHDSVPEPKKVRGSETPLWTQSLHIHPLAAHLYDGGADISFPIHTSVAFAHSVGLPDIILHGTATLSMAVKEILNREGGGDPRRLRGLSCHFTGMVLMDTDITIEVVGTEEIEGATEYKFVVLNHEGKRAIRNASVTLSQE